MKHSDLFKKISKRKMAKCHLGSVLVPSVLCLDRDSLTNSRRLLMVLLTAQFNVPIFSKHLGAASHRSIKILIFPLQG